MRLVVLVRSGNRSRSVLLWSPRFFFCIAMPLVMIVSFMVGYGLFYLMGHGSNVGVILVPLLGGYFLDAWRRATLTMSCTLSLLISQLGEGEEDPDERVRLLGAFREWLLANDLVGPNVSRWIWDPASRHGFALTQVYLDHLLEHSKTEPLQGPWEKIEDFLPIEERIRLLANQTKLAVPAMLYEEFGICNVIFFSTVVGLPMSVGLALHDPSFADHIAGTLGVLQWF